jgi:hypothetical protein
MASAIGNFACVEESFGWNATTVQTRSTDFILFDQRDSETKL